jgi:hypothetical protein
MAPECTVASSIAGRTTLTDETGISVTATPKRSGTDADDATPVPPGWASPSSYRHLADGYGR